MYSNILSRIRTKEEVEKLSEEVDMLLNSLYEQKGEGFESTLKGKIRAWVYEEMRKDWQDTAISKENYLKSLKEKLKKLKTLKLTLAFEPTDRSLDMFFSFVRQNVGGEVVLEITYDPTILAGVLIAYEGKYRDFSLKRVFEEEMLRMKEEVIEMLKHAG